MSARVVGAVLGLLVVGAVLTAWGVSGALRIREMQRQIAATERDIAALRTQKELLTLTIDRLRNDPEFLEKLAREDLGMVRPGDTVLKFPPKPK
jgi:cell division protein FtsB